MMNWFRSNTQKLLDDVNSYIPLSEMEYLSYIEEKIKVIKELVAYVDNKQLAQFLMQHILEQKKGQHVYSYNLL